jgi:hypothetical protein
MRHVIEYMTTYINHLTHTRYTHRQAPQATHTWTTVHSGYNDNKVKPDLSEPQIFKLQQLSLLSKNTYVKEDTQID